MIMNKILLALVLSIGLFVGMASVADGLVTYDAPTKTLTSSGSDTAEFGEYLLAADVAGGWGVVTSCGTGC